MEPAAASYCNFHLMCENPLVGGKSLVKVCVYLMREKLWLHWMFYLKLGWLSVDFYLTLTVKYCVQKSTFARKCNTFWSFPIVVLVFVEQGPGSPYHSPVARNSPLMSPLIGDPAGIQALNLDPSCPTVPESVLRLFLHLTFFSCESLLILEFKYLNLWSWS